MLSDVHHVFDWAMPPPDPLWILLGSILGVVDEKIGAIDELGVSQILANDVSLADSQYA
jgi:hypothetical protein